MDTFVGIGGNESGLDVNSPNYVKLLEHLTQPKSGLKWATRQTPCNKPVNYVFESILDASLKTSAEL